MHRDNGGWRVARPQQGTEVHSTVGQRVAVVLSVTSAGPIPTHASCVHLQDHLKNQGNKPTTSTGRRGRPPVPRPKEPEQQGWVGQGICSCACKAYVGSGCSMHASGGFDDVAALMMCNAAQLIAMLLLVSVQCCL